MHANVNFALFFLLGLCATQANAEMSGFWADVLQFFGVHPNSHAMGSAALARRNRGHSNYTFESYALMRERHTCVPDDELIMHMAEFPQQRKPPIMLRCLQAQKPLPAFGNGSSVLQIMKSVKEIVNLLKPIGNATKRHEPGNCVVVHFCTDTSLQCAHVAPMVNLLPHLFPTLPIAYIDAFEFTRFNAEFGIVSLPTLMIFHQGRPLIKYESPNKGKEKGNMHSFILRHTNVRGIDPRKIHPIAFRLMKLTPLSTMPGKTTDFNLFLAWAFILICVANYLRRTLLWKQLVEMVQRNWRESEETQMENIE